MPTVRDLLLRKGTHVVAVTPDTTVLAAAALMNERGIGGVVVLEGTRLVGIFSERDVMRRVVAAERAPATTRIGDVMTASVVTTTLETPIAECRALMTARRIRHLPVVSTDGLVGVVTTGDILAYEVTMQEATITELEKYVFDTR
ncbi:MAG: CBS domain-containing protein [Gemmatimonadaceae bacterium]|jgi:CBS domain-containing protein|nr:CBS domain-containing protein [Gemmatimonadaceae bacterium]